MANNLFFKSVLLLIFVVFLPSSIEKSISTTTKPSTSSIGVCQQPLRPGYCMGFFPRWFFNDKTKQCQGFIYGGCDGNSNNFLSKSACQLACHAGEQGIRKPTLKFKVKISKESRKKIDVKPKNSQPLPPHNQTTRPATPCEIEKKKAMDSNQSGIFVPNCDGQGNYETMQCWKPLGLKESCWCVDKNGRKTGEVMATGQGKSTCDKTLSLANSPCIKALKQSLDASILLHGMPIHINVFGHSFVPVCDSKTGLFSPRQCHNTNCWCVDPHTGAVLPNTFGVKGFVKC